MIPSISEAQTIQKPSIKFLEALGYEYISQEKALELRGGNLSNVLLKDILEKKLKEINTHDFSKDPIHLSPTAIDKAIKELDVSLDKGLKEANREITDLLIYGTTTQTESQKGKKSQNLRYIDFDNPSNNHFCVTEEFSIKRKMSDIEGDTRRPDLVLFINGIPFCVIELKKSNINIQEGISQLIRNQNENEEIPQLFKFVQICIAGNNQEAKYGTIFTSSEFYSLWEEESKENNPFTPQAYGVNIPDALDKLFASLLHKNRILELIESFIIFDGGVKKIARYQQFFAVKNSIERIQNNENSKNRGGLIWHTQGSGKSLTMSILASLIKKNIPKSRIVVVTDRKNLDKQIHGTFQKTGIVAKRAKSGKHLVELLKQGESVITTLVQKFKSPEKHNLVIDAQDIFLLVDESHRSHNGLLHNTMKDSIPNGCYIGFTGTPLTSKEKSSVKKFGNFIHKYTIEQALRDKAILPLYYEGRISKQTIADAINLDERFAVIGEDLSEQEKGHLKKKTKQATFSAKSRLEWIAFDIQKHFRENFQKDGFVAMFATSSKADAVAYYKIFKEEYKEIKTAFVISSPDTRCGYTDVNEENSDEVIVEWRKLLSAYDSEEAIVAEFEDGGIDILIVVDKLLTGFDAPRVACLYLDKKLKEHSLLQAIARANRLYGNKDRGFIIDYRGINKEMDNAVKIYRDLANFEEDDIKDVVFSICDILKELKTNHQNLTDFFAELEQFRGKGKPLEIYEQFLDTKEKRERFYELLSLFARSIDALITLPRYKESISEEEIKRYKNDLKFYLNLKTSVQQRYHEKIDFKLYETRVKNLVDRFLGADKVETIVELTGIFEEGFLESVDQQPNDRAKADKIHGAISQYIRENRESDPSFFDKLSEQIQKTIDVYNKERLEESERFNKFKAIYETLITHQNQQETQYPKELKTSSSRAFYGSLRDIFIDISDETIIQLANGIDKTFIEKSKKPNWKNNQDTRNEIIDCIEDLIFKEYNASHEELNTLEEQIMLIGISHYGN